MIASSSYAACGVDAETHDILVFHNQLYIGNIGKPADEVLALVQDVSR